MRELQEAQRLVMIMIDYEFYLRWNYQDFEKEFSQNT